MAMRRTLLTERFNLEFHTEQKVFPVYVITVAKGGIKLKESATPDAQPMLVSTVWPGDRIVLPGRNATMAQFASTLQRAILDKKSGTESNFHFAKLLSVPDFPISDFRRSFRDAPVRPFNSKNVFQRKLHDSRILGGDHLPKSIAVENGVGILHPEGVCQIKRFRAKFQLSRFT